MERRTLLALVIGAIDSASKQVALGQPVSRAVPIALVRERLLQITSADVESALFELERNGSIQLIAGEDDQRLDENVREGGVLSPMRGLLTFVARRPFRR